MKNYRLKKTLGAIAAFFIATAPQTASAVQGDPIISFHTSAFNPEMVKLLSFGIMSNKTTSIDVDFGGSITTYEVQPGITTDEVTWIQGEIPADGNIKVYGDPEAIDYVDLEGAFITDLEMSRLTNTSVLILAHNELKEFDFSPFRQLGYLDIMDNQFENLVLDNKLETLMLLDISYAGKLNPSFTLSNYPNLQQFIAQNCTGLEKIEPSACPGLLRLTVDGTDINSLDVSKNENLLILNISETRITDIDITKNAALKEFYCNHEGTKNNEYKISRLDLSGNPLLTRFFCSGNNLTELDVTANTELTDLYAGRNYLTHIDISKQDLLNNLSLRNNLMTFATMPVITDDKINFEWLPMRPMQLDPSYPEGAVIDLSDKVLRTGGETFAMAFSNNASDPSNPIELVEGVDFTYADGKVTMMTVQADSCHVEFYNTLWPDGILSTSNFMVKDNSEYGKPTRTISMTSLCDNGTPLSGHMAVNVRNASKENPVTIFMDYGDGELVPVTVAGLTQIEGSTKGALLGLYIPDGHFFTELSVTNLPLASADVSKARKLRSLTLENTGIYTIDLSWNNELERIDLSNNNLSSLDLTGDNKSVVKNVLTYLDASNNNISNFTIENRDVIRHIDLSHNHISDYDFNKLKAISSLNLSYNNLTELSIDECPELTDLNIAGNELSFIELPEEIAATLKSLRVENNRFNFSTLPLKTSAMEIYVYAPQKKIVIADRSFKVDLANLMPVVTDISAGESYPSTIEWIDSEGNILTEGSDYKFADGITKFNSNLKGKHVYGVLSNMAYPEFSGENMLCTTDTEVSDRPDTILASFTTTEDGQNVILSLASVNPDTYVYIDWKGDGSISEYPLQTQYTIFKATTTKDALVNVYSYPGENPIKVFSITGASMKDVDVSGLTNAINISIDDADLDKVELPASENLREVSFSNNRLKAIDLSGIPNLYSLSLLNNELENVDFSKTPHIEWLSVTGNQLKDLDLSNLKSLYQLDANENELTEIDLSANTMLGILNLEANMFDHIDLSANKELRKVTLSKNLFTFSSLPLPREEWGTYYTYAPQADIKATFEEGVVDLSSQENISGDHTKYLWYLGHPAINDETGELTGTMLEEGVDYTIENGVTTFLRIQKSDVVGVMLNEVFPYLALYTSPIDVNTTNVDNVSTDNILRVEGNSITVYCNASIYTADGITVETSPFGNGVKAHGLQNGIYIVTANGISHKVMIQN